MFKKTNLLLAAALSLGVMSAESIAAENIPITGTIQSKCSIYTVRQGVYGSPLPNELSTDPADGGIKPVVRYDVAQGGYYRAEIGWPNTFTSSPSLDDAVNFTGSVVVSEVSDVAMSAYETAKVEYDNIVEFDLTATGSTWFTIDSTATYGFDKSFPAGTYNAQVTAECIPN